MNRKFCLLISIGIILLTTLACQNPFQNKSPTPIPEPTKTALPTVTDTSELPSIPAGWLIYQNIEYGFEISYPPTYQALDDADNLYGWTNGVVLLYDGGQSYDIVIQVWDNEQDLAANYQNTGNAISTFTCGEKLISIFDITQDVENATVIATFRLIP